MTLYQAMARRRTVVIVSSCMSITTLLGCHQPPFPDNKPRTQFETYDRMRQQVTPIKEPDVFGSPKPAVRARLSNSGN